MTENLSQSSKEYVQRILKNLPEEKIPEVIESLKWVIRSVEKEVWMFVLISRKFFGDVVVFYN